MLFDQVNSMFSRRAVVQSGSVLLGAGFAAGAIARTVPLTATMSMHDDTALNASIPAGSSLRIVARSSVPPLPGKAPWHGAPDGGACVACNDGGWIYVSNSELDDGAGGAGALRFSARGELTGAYRILSGTSCNCAGGLTSWQTWLSCEESGDYGLVYECDPFGTNASVVRPALGAFNHEAVAVDRVSNTLYLTEDRPDGCLYRFVPKDARNLDHGVLQVAVHDGGRLGWVELPDPSARTMPTRYQISHAARFAGGEGVVWYQGRLFFTTKYDNRVWAYNTGNQRLEIVYDAARYSQPVLTGVDNICVGAGGELLVAEDGGDMQVVVVPAQGDPFALLTLRGQVESEITGVAWSPDSSRLYFSSQRGASGKPGDGITYELCMKC